MDEKKTKKKKKPVYIRVLRVFGWLIISIVGLVILIWILIQLPPVQNYARKKVVSYLQEKIKTPVKISGLDLDFPASIQLEGVYFEDQSGDTLLYGREINVGINILKLVSNKIRIGEVKLDGIVAKITREPPDSTFNFQYIIDAFASKEPAAPQPEDTTALDMDVDQLIIHSSHIIYRDLYTGNDLDVQIGDFRSDIDRMDVSRMAFDIPSIEARGIHGYFHQLEPMQKEVEDVIAEASAEADKLMQISNEVIRLSDINFEFNSDASHLQSSYVIGEAEIHPRTLDLPNMLIALKDAKLKDAHISIITHTAQPEEPERDTVADTAPAPSLTLLADKLDIINSSFKMFDESHPKLKEGLDYSHLYLTEIDLQARQLKYASDTTRASLISASLKDHSGFQLNDVQVDFLMTENGISLTNMKITTPGSLLRESAIISYPSLDALGTNPGKLGLDIHLQQSHLIMKDLYYFMPSLKDQLQLPPDEVIYADLKINGTVDNLQLNTVKIHGVKSTSIDVSGAIKGLPDVAELKAQLDIKQFSTTSDAMNALLPAGTLPSHITLPRQMAIIGAIKGDLGNMKTNIRIKTSLGDLAINGSASSLSDMRAIGYDMDIKAVGLQLGELLTNPDMGALTTNISIKGRGTDPRKANINFRVDIPVVEYNHYTYHNIAAGGTLENQLYKIVAKVNDPNIGAQILANGSMEGAYPSLHLRATIDSIRAKPLNFTTDVLKYHGRVSADFENLDPDSLRGALLVTHSVLFRDDRRVALDTIQLVAKNGAEDSIILYSDIFTMALKGKYKLSQMGNVFIRAIDPYFSIAENSGTLQVAPYEFTIEGSLYEHPALLAMLPALKDLKQVNFGGRFSSDSGWNFILHAPHVNYNATEINNVQINAQTVDSVLAFYASMERVHSGASVNIFQTRLTGNLQHDVAEFALNIEDEKKEDKYHLEGSIGNTDSATYVFSLSPDSLLLNYTPWNITPGNAIELNDGMMMAKNFRLSQKGQLLNIESHPEQPKNPLHIHFEDFEIATLTGIVQEDSLMINGLINGTVSITDLQTDPVFTTDLTIENISTHQDTIGTLTAKINNTIKNTFHADVGLQGHGNDITISGDYIIGQNASNIDLMANINRFQMQTLKALSQGAITEADGYIYGAISIEGATTAPGIDGNLKFNNTLFVPAALNNQFKVDNEAIAIVNNKGILFNTFVIRDKNNNQLVLNGALNTEDWMNYEFNLGIEANHFQAINSTAKDNKLFYGSLVFSTDMDIRGTPSHPRVNGSLTINEDTKFTIVLPTEDPGIAKREGVVRFVDYSAIAEDTLFRTAFDSLEQSSLVGYDISLNIIIEREAEFNLIVDPANGDFLHMRGTGRLSGGIDPSGNVTLTGTYEIEEGSYSLSFNFLRRKFLISRGSRITWTGAPTEAQVDLTAVYVSNTPPYNLVQDVMQPVPITYKQELPFEVELHMDGELLKPEITFDIVLPEDETYVAGAGVVETTRDRLAQLRQQPSELNKQVFALMLLNRFVGQNPFASGGSGMSASSFARQSVSRLLSEQLNRLTENLIEGVDFNFDLKNTRDYSTGTPQDRTNLNVGVSKSLLNDRLTVTVGSNFEVEGAQTSRDKQSHIADDISLNYKLSKDGRYMLRVYRESDYTGAVEGYIIETGVSFIITLDYNKLKEIFMSREEREKKKEIKEHNKEMEK